MKKNNGHTTHNHNTERETERDCDKGREPLTQRKVQSSPVQSVGGNQKQKKFQSPSLKNTVNPSFIIVKPPFVPHYNHLFWPVLQLMKAVKLKYINILYTHTDWFYISPWNNTSETLIWLSSPQILFIYISLSLAMKANADLICSSEPWIEAPHCVVY